MLIHKARALATTLHNERKKKSYWYEAYIRARREKKCKMPKRFSENFTADHLETLIKESIKVGELNEKSVLYYLMQDTLKSLQHKPNGMRYSQAVLKFCVSIANKVHQQGYESLRTVLPLPCWTTLRAYRINMKSSDPISEENIAEFKKLIELSGCRGVGGLHWDEIYVKKGLYICKRTNELIGFEDLNLPEDILATYDTINNHQPSTTTPPKVTVTVISVMSVTVMKKYYIQMVIQ